MLNLEFFWIIKGIWRMFTDPLEFFKEIRSKPVGFTIPVIFLVLMGVCMGMASYSKIPEELRGKAPVTDLVSVDIIRDVWLIKAESFLFPVWVILFWVLFVVALSTSLKWNSGWGEYSGIFNCTSFLIYHNFLVSLVLLFFSYFLPDLIIVPRVLQVIAAIVNYYMLIEIARGAGELSIINGTFAATIPAFFFTLLWLSYRNILRLFVLPT